MSVPPDKKYYEIEGLIDPSVLYIKPKNALKTELTESAIMDFCVDSIVRQPDYTKKRYDQEMILQIANLAYNAAKDKKLKQTIYDNLETVVVSICHRLFNLNDDEKDVLYKTITFLKDRKLVKLVSGWKKFKKYCDRIKDDGLFF